MALISLIQLEIESCNNQTIWLQMFSNRANLFCKATCYEKDELTYTYTKSFQLTHCFFLNE